MLVPPVMEGAFPAAGNPCGSGGPLVGRDAELDRIDAFLSGSVRSGRPLLLLGDAGVGKTALLATAADRAAARGMRVLAATGVEYRAGLSYGGLVQLLGAVTAGQPSMVLGSALTAVQGRGAGPAPHHDAVAEGLLTVLRRLPDGGPVLLAVDDVQWLDPASAQVLGQVARRLDGAGVGMLCTARPGAEGYFDHGGLPVLDVAPLSAAASERLLVQRFPALALRVRRRLMAEAEGNPLALLELPVTLSGPQRAASESLPERLPLSRRLQSAFASRVTGLPSATRHLLLLAALDGTGDLRVLRRAAAGRCSLKHLGSAERAQLIHVVEPTGLRFRHPLTRSAVVELSTSDQRRGAHRALARAWADVPERTAWHLAQASDGPDEQVAGLLERVAAGIGHRGDGPAAVAALLRAADLTPRGPERARRLARAAYTGASLTGDLRAVPRLLDDARRTAPGPASLAAAVAGSAYLLGGVGDVDTAHRLLSGAVSLRPEPYDPQDATLTEALHTLLMVCFFGGRPELWDPFDAAVAGHPALPELLATTRSTLADPARATAATLGRLDGAVAGLAHESDPLRIVRVATAGAYVDRLGGCTEALQRVVAGGRRGEHLAPAIDALFLLGNHAWLTGQWPELRESVREGLELCEQYHYPLLAWPGTYLLACAAAVRGDHTAVRDLTDRMERWAGPRRAETVRVYGAHARALSALGRRDFEEAYRQAAFIAPPGTLPEFAPHALWAFMDLVEAAVRTGRREQAREHVAAGRAADLGALSPRLRMVLHACSALAAGDEGHPGFQEALAVEGATRWPFDLARVHLYYGERLRRYRAPAQAGEQLRAAVEVFRRLGADPWSDRAEQELRACGSPAREPAAPRPASAALTPQEREIAGLAAAGLSNKQIAERLFLSPRTVSTHLYHVFPKLGVSSRAALRDALGRTEPRHKSDDGSGESGRVPTVPATGHASGSGEALEE
ncbi:AAA family ATPase [Streptomyces sp. NPDC060020]|uniref:helix-turn-helix transcriptional regulator n=1 Tax=Streptomyces sp. NPDC060020 TaxID=3347038 RepID=UPI0036C9A4F5